MAGQKTRTPSELLEERGFEKREFGWWRGPPSVSGSTDTQSMKPGGRYYGVNTTRVLEGECVVVAIELRDLTLYEGSGKVTDHVLVTELRTWLKSAIETLLVNALDQRRGGPDDYRA